MSEVGFPVLVSIDTLESKPISLGVIGDIFLISIIVLSIVQGMLPKIGGRALGYEISLADQSGSSRFGMTGAKLGRLITTEIPVVVLTSLNGDCLKMTDSISVGAILCRELTFW